MQHQIIRPSYIDFLIIVTGTPESYHVAAYGPNGVSVPVTPCVWKPSEEIQTILFSLAKGYVLDHAQAVQLGSALFNTLFQRPIANALIQAQAILPDQTHLRLKLAIQPPELAILPWEIMYDPDQQFFLAARLINPIVRLVESSQPTSPAGLKQPISVLYARSQPKNLAELNLSASEQALREALGNTAHITTLSPVTPSGLREHLRSDYAFFHFDGHAAFYEGKQEGFLYLEDEAGRSQRWSGELLASYLEGSNLRLVVLAACQSGMGSEQQRFAGIAHQLMKSSSLPAVVAMQFPIPDEAAIAFNRGFYGALAAMLPVEAAVLEGRRAILEAATGDRLADLDWATPILFLRGEGQLFYTSEDEPAPGESPYKGLQYFDEGDAALFFGRSELVRNLAERLTASNFLAVVGASGSGKTSVVRAGLLPLLRKTGSWTIVPPFTPGMASEPLLALCNAVLPLLDPGLGELDGLVEAKRMAAHLQTGDLSLREVAGRILHRQGTKRLALVVDQFEELFTTFRDKTSLQTEFVHVLTAASQADSPVTVILTLRADFYAPCTQFSDLRMALEQHQALIGPMTSAELRQAIEEPARIGSWQLEEGLMENLLRDVGDEPGNLPLLSHALLETWLQRKGRRLTLQGYQQSGGVHGAIAHTADAVLNGLSGAQKEIARRIFLGLTELGEGTQDTRRRATLEEIAPHESHRQEVEVVLKTLTDARLVTTSDQAAEVAHEALIREWPSLRQWLDADRQSLRLHRELNSDARQWVALERDAGALYRGARLAAAEEWSAEHEPEMIALEKEFLQSSQAALEQEEQEREAQRKRELEQALRLTQTQRQRAVILTIGLGVAIILMIISFSLWRQSGANLQTAQNNAGTATNALGLSEKRGTQAAQSEATALANEQIAKEQRSAAQAASTQAAQNMIMAQNNAATAEAERGHAEEQSKIALARQLAAQSKVFFDKGTKTELLSLLLALESMRLFPLLDAEQILQFNNFGRPISMKSADLAVFSPDGRLVVSAVCNTYAERDCLKSTILVWEAATGKEIAQMTYANSINDFAFSSDSKRILSGSDDGTARIWEASTGKEILRLPHADKVSCVAFSPDGRYVATGGWEGIARDWDAVTGKEIARMTQEGAINSVAFSPDSKYVVSGSWNDTVRVWEATTGREIFRKPIDMLNPKVVFSPDGRYIVSSLEYTIYVWNVFSGKEISHMTHDNSVNSVAFSPDGQYVVSGSDDHTARIWETATGKEISRMEHADWVNSVAFSKNGKYIVTGSNDFTARVWNAATGKEIARRAFEGNVTLVESSPNDQSILSIGSGVAEIWEATGSHKNVAATMRHDNYVNIVAISPDGSMVVSGSCDQIKGNTCSLGTARVWDPNTGEEISRMTHDGSVDIVAFSPNGQYVVSSGDNIARVWEAATGKEISRMTHDMSVTSVAFSPDGQYVVSGSLDTTVRVWEALTGKEKSRMAHSDWVNSVAFSSDGRYIVSGGKDYLAQVWEAATGKPIAYMIHGDIVNSAVFSPDGKFVVSAGYDNIRVWETTTGKDIIRFGSGASSAALSPDGKYVVADQGYAAIVYEIATGKEISHLNHFYYVSSVAFSPDGQYVVSGSNDYTARVWETATGKEIARMTHDWDVVSVVFSPDGRYVVSGSYDGTARAWSWRPVDLIAETCQRLTRNLTRAEWQEYIGDILPYQAVCPNLPIEPEPTP